MSADQQVEAPTSHADNSVDEAKPPKTAARGLKILFLSSDTGGGHRASAESLAKQFQLLFPGSTYDLLDVVEKDGVPPYNSLVSYYKHLSAHPSQWKLVYSVSNSRAFEMLADAHLKLMCERAVRKSIQSYNPDVVVSVHPLMTNVPVLSCSKISNQTGKHLPIFTVVTDLGSAHCLWFANGVEKMFVGSEKVYELAQARGKVPTEKLILSGLPIRHEFAIQAEKLGDRYSAQGRTYQQLVRSQLDLPVRDRTTILAMGGGEGVGSLGAIVDSLFFELSNQGLDALIIVVCGRNTKLKESLETKDWDDVLEQHRLGTDLRSLSIATCGQTTGCISDGPGTMAGSIKRILSKGSLTFGGAMGVSPRSNDSGENPSSPTNASDHTNVKEAADAISTQASSMEEPQSYQGKVDVIGLGFVSNIADYMVASDILVTKAGPGTISEAAALSLPVMLTSFLPGQEEGNVDYVVEGKFGAFCSDSDPMGIAEELCMWLKDEPRLQQMAQAAKEHGAPYAARDIAKAIGDSTLQWREINEDRQLKSAGSNDSSR